MKKITMIVLALSALSFSGCGMKNMFMGNHICEDKCKCHDKCKCENDCKCSKDKMCKDKDN